MLPNMKIQRSLESRNKILSFGKDPKYLLAEKSHFFLQILVTAISATR